MSEPSPQPRVVKAPKRRWLWFESGQTRRNFQKTLGLIALLLTVVILALVFQPPTLKETPTTDADLLSAKNKINDLIAARVESQQITRGFNAAEMNAYFRSLLTDTQSTFGSWLPAFGGVGFEVRKETVVMYEITEWKALGLRIVYRLEAMPRVRDGRLSAEVLSASIGQLRLGGPLAWVATHRFSNMFREVTASPLYGTLPEKFEVSGGEVRITNALPPPKKGV